MKCLMVMAHPDDELIFGWPIVFDEKIDKQLLVCSSDENNAERKWCANRRAALAEVCDVLGIAHDCLPYSSGFYRLKTRPTNDLLRFYKDVTCRIDDSSHEFVFTHNPHGEYGHADHRMLFSMAAESVGPGQLLFSDIHIEVDWPLAKRRSTAATRRLYTEAFGPPRALSSAQRDTFDTCKAVYQRYGCWTWSQNVATQCQLYRI